MFPDKPYLTPIQEELEIAVLFAQEELVLHPLVAGEEIISPLVPDLLTIICVTKSFFLCAQIGSTEEIAIPKEGCYRLAMAIKLVTDELSCTILAPSINMNDILK